MTGIIKKACLVLFLLCLSCTLSVPFSAGQENNETVIIAPHHLSSTEFLPIVIRVMNGLGGIDTTVTGSFRLDADYAYLGTSDVAVKNGVGSVLKSVEASNDFSLVLGNYSGRTSVSATTSLPVQRHVNRTISSREVWSAASEHRVVGSLTIREGGELIIEQGAAVILGSKTNVMVNGTIIAEGTEDFPITFMAANADSHWGGIEIRKGAGSFAYCFFVQGGADSSQSFGHSDSQPVLKVYSGSLDVDNGFFFDNTGKALGGYNGVIDIDSSLLSRCDTGAEFKLCRGAVTNTYFTDIPSEDESRVDDDNDLLYFAEIYPGSDEPVQVSGCYFVNGHDDGIDIFETTVNISGNVFLDIADKGVSIGGAAENVTITHNLFVNTDIAVAVKDSSNALIDHTTIDDTEIGIYAYIKGDPVKLGGTAVVSNTIFSRCHNTVIKYDNDSKIEVSYSLSDSGNIPGTGNIEGDAQFVSIEDRNYTLRADSPAIDAGNPQYQPDDDASRTDIGVFPFYRETEQIVLNEINYNSLDTNDPGDWLELYNPNDYPIDMSGWIFRDSNTAHGFVFPFAYTLAAGEYGVICADRALFANIFPEVTPCTGEMDFGLSGAGEFICLIDSNGVVVDSLHYDDNMPWPEGPDGSGSTLSLINPDLDNALPSSWAASKYYGTPGKINDTFQYYIKESDQLVTSIALEQNYPNPFNAVTTIPFILALPDRVTLDIYSMNGQKVSTVSNNILTPGPHELIVNLDNVSSGVYVYRISTSTTSKTKSMLLIK